MTTYDLHGLPEAAQAMLHDVLVTQGRRYVLAYCPGIPHAVVRHKNVSGVAEWFRRDWRLFEGRSPFIVDVTHELLDLLRDLYARTRGEVVIAFRPDAGARTSHIESSAIVGSAFVVGEGRPDGAARRLVACEPGTEVDAEVAAGRLYDLTTRWAGDVVPYPVPLVTPSHQLMDGVRTWEVRVTVRNVPWGLAKPAAVFQVRDCGAYTWDIALPLHLVEPFTSALHAAGQEARQLLDALE